MTVEQRCPTCGPTSICPIHNEDSDCVVEVNATDLYSRVQSVIASRAESAEAALGTARREVEEMRERLAAVERLLAAAEWHAEHSLSRTFTGEPFPPLVYVADLRAALANPSAAQGEGEVGK